jgi:hypothetical protein
MTPDANAQVPSDVPARDSPPFHHRKGCLVALVLAALAAIPLAMGVSALISDHIHTLKPAISSKLIHVDVTAVFDTSGHSDRVQPPDGSSELSVAETGEDLDFVLTEYPGYTWVQEPTHPGILTSGEIGRPVESCVPAVSGCVSEVEDILVPSGTGTTTVVFHLTAGDPPAPGSALGLPSAPASLQPCPSSAPAPPPAADRGCVLGTDTFTVTVTN